MWNPSAQMQRVTSQLESISSQKRGLTAHPINKSCFPYALFHPQLSLIPTFFLCRSSASLLAIQAPPPSFLFGPACVLWWEQDLALRPRGLCTPSHEENRPQRRDPVAGAVLVKDLGWYHCKCLNKAEKACDRVPNGADTLYRNKGRDEMNRWDSDCCYETWFHLQAFLLPHSFLSQHFMHFKGPAA